MSKKETRGATAEAPWVLDRDEGTRYWLLTGQRIVKATADSTGGHSVGEERMPAGTATPMVVHQDESEAYYVLEGEVDLYIADGPPVRLRPGSFALVPAGTPHAHVVVHDARWIGVSGPQFEGFLDEAGVAVEPGDVTGPAPQPDRLAAAAERHGTRIVGPPPTWRASRRGVTG